MSILSTIYPSLVQKNPYELQISQSKIETYIKMSMYTPHFHTNYFPSTYNVLSQYFPAVLKTKCFNKKNLPFDREVLNTEFGHLFEHILLAYLCQYKLASGSQTALYSGLTKWNWNKDLKGTFHITLSVERSESEIFNKALRSTKILMKKIINSPIVVSGVN